MVPNHDEMAGLGADAVKVMHLNLTRLNVRGNFTSAALQQITVNGILAFVSGTNFDALNVPLDAGTNEITAIVEDLTGYRNVSSIIVSSITTAVAPVQLQATPVGGFAPLPVTFSVQTNLPGTILQVLYDFNGDRSEERRVGKEC